MENMNIFELASKAKLRFTSDRGEITTEQLWDLHLQSKSGFDLDTIGQDVQAKLEGMKTRSLVNTKPDSRVTELELKLEIIKHIIAIKQEENAKKLAAADKATQKAKLIDVLSRKQDAALEQLTPEQIQARLEELSK